MTIAELQEYLNNAIASGAVRDTTPVMVIDLAVNLKPETIFEPIGPPERIQTTDLTTRLAFRLRLTYLRRSGRHDNAR